MSSGIAIVGISAELPSGTYAAENLTHDAFFEFLLNEGISQETIPADRFNVDAWKGYGLGQIRVDQGSFLKDIDMFDNVEFGISSQDARTMAPATRLMIHNCFLALLDSGIDYRMRRVGCYTAGNSFELTNVSEPDEYEPKGSFAGAPAMIANRISNHLDLLGPSVPTDTACSSSLTALHLAVQALLNEECDSAVVAGCQLNHRFMDWVSYSQGSILSKDGKCKPFDAGADGFGRAEGCVAVVLKPLKDALRDHDRIYATILGSSINSSGAGAPPGAPVGESQRDAMIEAFKRANRKPQEVDFIELHATGTAKGDPTEANWVGAEFQRSTDILIGSVKGNIGHTEIVAFLASLSKVVSVFQHHVIPPNVNITTLNPAIAWDEYKLRVPRKAIALPCRSGQRPLIAMAGSGIGGSNGHVVLEGPPAMESIDRSGETSTSGPILLVASGLSPHTAQTVAESIERYVQENETGLSGMATVLGRRSRQMSWRSFAVVSHDRSLPVIFSAPQHCPRMGHGIGMVFSGQGPQYADMGRDLFRAFPVFRRSILQCDAIYKSVTQKSLIADYGLFCGEAPFDAPDPWPISLTLPSLGVFQIALFDLLVSLGVRADMIVGHSAGETTALYASGAASKEMAVELAIIRGQIFSAVESAGGTMVALSCSAEEASYIIDQVRNEDPEGVVEIACLNAPAAVAVSGTGLAMDRVIELATAHGILGRKLRTRVPIHSSMMDMCRDEYRMALQDLFHRYPGPHVPQIPTYSTLTGALFSGPYDAEYFWKNTRSEVRFTEAIAAMVATSENLTFIEITPHPVLASYMTSMVPESTTVLSLVRRPKRGQALSEQHDLLQFLGKLTSTGHSCVDFTVLNGRACYETEFVLPPYPFSKRKYPLYPDTSGYAKQIEPRNGPLNHNHLKMNKETHPTLAQHVITEEPIVPAAGYFEMAMEFGASALINVKLRSMFSLSAARPVKVAVKLDGAYWSVESISPSAAAHVKKLHADGYLTFEPPRSCGDLDISVIRKRCYNHVGSEFYPALSYFSTYGDRLQRVTNIYYSFDEALVSIRGTDETLTKDGNYILHPAILDACLHITGYKPFNGDVNPFAYYLPSYLAALVMHQVPKASYFPPHLYAYTKVKLWTPHSMCYDIALVDDSGRALCTLQGLEVARHTMRPPPDISRPLNIVLQPVYKAGFDSQNAAAASLFSVADSFVFEYKLGQESDLQWHFSGLNVMQELSIWILAGDGRDGGAALGMTRALRKEYLSWTIRLVVFPASFTHEMRYRTLGKLPPSLGSEHDLVVSPDGELVVPRMHPLPPLPAAQNKSGSLQNVPEPPVDHAVIQVRSLSVHDHFVGYTGSVVSSNTTDLENGATVLGLVPASPKEYIVVDAATVCAVSAGLIQYPPAAAASVSGLIVAALAPGLGTFSRTGRLNTLRILLTHSDSSIGRCVSQIYAMKKVNLVEVTGGSTLLELSGLGYDDFDLIITGYEAAAYCQILKTLLRTDRGRIFSWNGSEGLVDILARDPCAIGDALRATTPFLGEALGILKCTQDLTSTPMPVNEAVIATPRHATFDCEKTYLLVGGIGSIGANIALFMYQRGARHIVLTSRSGEQNLRGKNVILRRTIEHLRSLQDLHLRLEAVDATSCSDMNSLVASLDLAIGGCMILTAVLSDRVFQHLSEKEFSTVFHSKVGVFDTVARTINLADIDFLIAFSSVSGAFGSGGQANYGGANTALEEAVSSMKNGFSFVCPGILNSSLMLAGGAGVKDPRLSHFVDWSLSSEDMILWLEDAICKFQNGLRFSRYVPDLDWAAMDRTHGMSKLGEHLVPPRQDKPVTEGSEMDTIADIIRDVLNIPAGDLSREVPFTSYGIDSLSASRLSFLLRPFLEITQIQLLANVSLNDLQQYLHTASDNGATTVQTQTKGPSKVDAMNNLLAKYSEDIHTLAALQPSSGLPSPAGNVVLLTGSTGAFGCNILARLLQDPKTCRVYALNRARAGLASSVRQATAFATHGLPTALVTSSRLVFLEGNVAAEDSGIESHMLDELLSSVTHIIHNAWKVDFYMQLDGFEDLIRGTRRLLDLAAQSKLRVLPSVSFISTVGVYQHTTDASSPAPEAPIKDPRVSVQTGYLESKWVAERLVQIAGEKTALRTNVIRVGLLTGGVNGSWDTSHWLPALVQSGLYVGCLPEGDEPISWIPVDVAASAIVDMLDLRNETVHLIHPRPVLWTAVMAPIASMLGVPLVPYVEWFARLEATARDTEFEKAHSSNASHSSMRAALRLTDFYRLGLQSASGQSTTESMGLMPYVAVGKSVRASSTLQDAKLAQLGANDAKKWLAYWREVGFLPAYN